MYKSAKNRKSKICTITYFPHTYYDEELKYAAARVIDKYRYIIYKIKCNEYIKEFSRDPNYFLTINSLIISKKKIMNDKHFLLIACIKFHYFWGIKYTENIFFDGPGKTFQPVMLFLRIRLQLFSFPFDKII